MNVTDTKTVVNPYTPTADDEAWYTANVTTLQPQRTLIETIEHQVAAYKAWRTPVGDFLAVQMERLAQLVQFTGATTAVEFAERMEVEEETARTNAYDHGFADGRRTALGIEP